jgi:hypothetical protein
VTDTKQIIGVLGFNEALPVRMKFHANNNGLDLLNIVPHAVPIIDARALPLPPSIDVEGFMLTPHESAVPDFRDQDVVRAIHMDEIRRLLLDISGADHVEVNAPGVLRFSESSAESGALDNSRPARFVHIDVSDMTAANFYARSNAGAGRRVRRHAQFNVWRVLTPPPQDVPLAVCDARTIHADDLIAADAIFDKDGAILFSFEALLIRHNPAQRWCYFSDMHPGEVLIFKTHDSDPARAHHVPHGAFDNSACPADAPPRASIEMRGMAFWYE